MAAELAAPTGRPTKELGPLVGTDQHAQMRFEGMPDSALYVRTVLTVGNYDYTQVCVPPMGNVTLVQPW